MSLDDKLIVEPAVLEHHRAIKRWFGTWPANCDMCGLPLSAFKHFIDGRLRGRSTWALMCPLCHDDYGTGLGVGSGQKYDCKTLEKLEG